MFDLWILSVRKRNIMSEEKKFASWFSLGSIDNLRKKSGLSCSFIIFAALNIAMVAVGADTLNYCTVDYMIPIYLVGEKFTKVFKSFLLNLLWFTISRVYFNTVNTHYINDFQNLSTYATSYSSYGSMPFTWKYYKVGF